MKLTLIDSKLNRVMVVDMPVVPRIGETIAIYHKIRGKVTDVTHSVYGDLSTGITVYYG